jgi:hypothetical protein
LTTTRTESRRPSSRVLCVNATVLDRSQVDTMFAICNYVPCKAETSLLIRQTFPHLYMFYPDRRDHEGMENL